MPVRKRLPSAAHAGDVVAAAAEHEARALGEVGARRSSAATNSGISAGSVEPSASSITMMSPVAAANPQARALPLPRAVWVTTRTSGRRRAGDRDGVVGRVAVDEDHLVDDGREPGQHVRQVRGLVQRRDHRGDALGAGVVRQDRRGGELGFPGPHECGGVVARRCGGLVEGGFKRCAHRVGILSWRGEQGDGSAAVVIGGKDLVRLLTGHRPLAQTRVRRPYRFTPLLHVSRRITCGFSAITGLEAPQRLCGGKVLTSLEDWCGVPPPPGGCGRDRVRCAVPGSRSGCGRRSPGAAGAGARRCGRRRGWHTARRTPPGMRS